MSKSTTFSTVVRLAIGLFSLPFNVPNQEIDLGNYPNELVIPMGGNTFQTAGYPVGQKRTFGTP
jgi:hypothetical protein